MSKDEKDGVPTDLGNIGGGAWNTPVAINNEGQIVGFANTSGDENAGLSPTAFIWTKAAGMQAIPPVGTDTNDIAFDLNNKGHVVGFSSGANGARAFLYQNGQMSDLNALVIQPTSLFLVLAQGVNDSGEITGTAVDTNTGLTVGFLAVPVFDGSGSGAASKGQAGGNSHQAISSESLRRQLQQLPGLTGLVFRAMGSK